MSESEEEPKTGFKLTWWQLVLGIIIIGVLYGKYGPQDGKNTQNTQTSTLFDDVSMTIETMEQTGVGDFYRYNCDNSGQCQAYIGSRPEPKKDHAVTSMSIEGTENKVQSITITCIVWNKTKNKKATRQHFYNIESKAIQYLGGSQSVADSLYQRSVPNIDFGQYSASSRVEDDTYEITITRKI